MPSAGVPGFNNVVRARQGGKGRAALGDTTGGLDLGKPASSGQRLCPYRWGRAHATKLSSWVQEALRIAIGSMLWMMFCMWRKKHPRGRYSRHDNL